MRWMLATLMILTAPWVARAEDTPAKVLGTWNLKYDPGDAKVREPVLVVETAAKGLKAKFTEEGHDWTVPEIDFRDGELVFVVTGKYEGKDVSVTYNAKPEGETLHGEGEWKLDGMTGTFSFEGTRTARPKTDDAGPIVLKLWENGAPGSEGKSGDEVAVDSGKPGAPHRRVSNIHNPTLTVFLPPKEIATGASVIIAPGGAHKYLTLDNEGLNVAKWLASKGVAGIVLKYRLANEKDSTYKVAEHALADARRSIRLVRSKAAGWGLDPKKVGFMGFSAGGELAILTAIQPAANDNAPSTADPIDAGNPRPDFLVLIYPGYNQPEMVVPKSVPPTFIAVADDDRKCAEVSVTFYQALKKAGVPGELHIYSKGGHGFGIAPRPLPITSWPDRLREWLGAR